MLIEGSSTDDLIPDDSSYKVYKKRWFIAILLCYENLLNAYLWIGYAPVINMAIIEYQTNESVFNFSSAIFPLITVIFGFPTIWAIVKYGLRFTFLIAGLLNFICCFGRFIGSISSSLPASARVTIFIVSQFIGAFAQSFVMFTPAKIALRWFPDNQRTTANSIAALGNPFGVMLGSLLAPIIVKSSQQIINFDILTLCMGIFGVILLIPVIKTAEPPEPPSYAAHLQKTSNDNQEAQSVKEQIISFANRLKVPLKNGTFVFIIFLFGMCLTYFTMVSAYIQQILCTKGYSNKFAGIAGAIMILSGLILAAITAPIVDYTKSLFTSVKVSFFHYLTNFLAIGVVLEKFWVTS